MDEPTTTKRCPFCAEEIQAAARVCRFCQRSLDVRDSIGLTPRPSTQLTVAVRDQLNPRAPTITPKRILLFLAGVTVLVLIGLLNAAKNLDTIRPSTRPVAARLSVDGRFTGTHFSIKNTGNDPWSDVLIEVNDGFRTRTASIGAGELVNVPAREFANKDGLRFNPFQMKPRELYIRATVNGQVVSYGGRFPE